MRRLAILTTGLARGGAEAQVALLAKRFVRWGGTLLSTQCFRRSVMTTFSRLKG